MSAKFSASLQDGLLLSPCRYKRDLLKIGDSCAQHAERNMLRPMHQMNPVQVVHVAGLALKKHMYS